MLYDSELVEEEGHSESLKLDSPHSLASEAPEFEPLQFADDKDKRDSVDHSLS